MKHTVRTDKLDGTGRVEIDPYTRGKAIRLHCTECMGFADPATCTSPNCALYPYRKKTYMAYESRQDAPTPILEAQEAREGGYVTSDTPRGA